MNRRSFLRLASAAAVGAATFDPERLLWTPGGRTHFDLWTPYRVGDVVVGQPGMFVSAQRFTNVHGWTFFQGGRWARMTTRGNAGPIGVVKSLSPIQVQVSGHTAINVESYDVLADKLGKKCYGLDFLTPTQEPSGVIRELTMAHPIYDGKPHPRHRDT